MTFLEWIGRVIMLVLAGMITLSIIGAIAAIPSGRLSERIGMVDREAPMPPEAEPTPAAETRPSSDTQQPTRGEAPIKQVGAAAAPREAVDPAEWLEAITYALLALVGIAAFAAILMWRMLHQSRRIADALETISAASPPPTPSPRIRASAGG